MRRLRRHDSINPGALKGYDIAPEVPVAPREFQKIQQLLQQPSSYDWGPYEKGCIVDYGVVFTFRSEHRTVRVALCFNCNWLGVFDGLDESLANINSEMDFDPIRPQLVAIAKAIYSDDPEIQSLKPKH